jgi:hypothetical protein
VAREVDGSPQGCLIGLEVYRLQAGRRYGPHAARRESGIEVEVEGPEEEGPASQMEVLISLRDLSISVSISIF